ncbi:DUF7256 domain-containing protein [Agrobacterium rosae]|uniref:Uncharacterized protein n=1 Tax=Agrobacterium rosae TaxID=1972867 RepID=A0A1R3U5U3_9HYPH|nr:hypothetical protein [Agrobacterium rosae]SCX31879.1 hypothetical protein DSM25559_3822 [Agrobacterium rosae]
MAASETVDLAALAALRPKMPMAKVEEAMGSAWRPLAPHKGGKIDILENSQGIVVWIDRMGTIGRIEYNHQCKLRIEGIAMGMSSTDALSIMPDMEIGDDLEMMKGVRFGSKQFSEGYVFGAKFTLDTVNGMSFSNPAAEYPQPTAPPYPAASGAPGAPFEDVNFKLVVLSALLDAKEIDLGTPQQLASHVLKRPFDYDNEGYELIPQALEYMARYPLTPALLEKVGRIDFDGGSTIYPYAWYFWDGEDDVFDIHNIGGISLCSNVTSLHAVSMLRKIDIRDLLPLQKLERLTLDVDIEHIEALLDMPALKEIRVLSDPVYNEVTSTQHMTRMVFETLKARGVRVWVHWMSRDGGDPAPAFE